MAGAWSFWNIPLDALPDITNNQVQIVTNSPTSPPQEMEQQITLPIELAMQNLPSVREVRSVSRYGLSVVTVVFEEEVPTLEARQFVREQLDMAVQEIPRALGRPQMMPITTGLGEIYQYVLTVDSSHIDRYSLMDLRTIQDWIVKRQLSGTKGIIEVSSFGGQLKQYEIAVDPSALMARDLTINEVVARVRAAHENTGGSYIERDDQAYYIRALGRVESMEDMASIFLASSSPGKSVILGDVAEVREGSAQRYGAMTMDGVGEVVGGITLMLKGENSDQTTRNVQSRVEEIRGGLPEGVDIYPYLDRAELVDQTTATIQHNLLMGGGIVILVLILLLGNWRAGLIVASIVPLSLLFAFILMQYFGVSANLMSLGAIDFGIIVDSAVIVVEGIVHYLFARHMGARLSSKQMDEAVVQASTSMMKPASFGLFTTLVVFLPILALVGIEGKMFHPMALTLSFALIGTFLLSVTYLPVMSSLLLKNKIRESRGPSYRLMELLKRQYRPLLRFSLGSPLAVVLPALGFLVLATVLFSRMGSEFIPTLEEGDLAMQVTLPPGSSLSESIRTTTAAEKVLLSSFPEVEHVVSKIGTAEIPTDPMAIEEADVMIILKDKSEWVSAKSREELADKMDEALKVFTGVSFEFTQPIQLRFNELMTGVKSDVAIKVFGESMSELKRIADEMAKWIEEVPGAGDVRVEQTAGLRQWQIKYDRSALARHGIAVTDVNTVIRTAYAGEFGGTIFEEERRFDMVIRLDSVQNAPLNLSDLRIKTQDGLGPSIPITEVVSARRVRGPMQISRENSQRRVTIGVNIRNRDVSSFISEVQGVLGKEINIPPGYFVSYGGDFENLERAADRLRYAIPVALLLILSLLYLSFRRVSYALLIFSSVPFSFIGGVMALYVRDMPFSISAGIGFIALFGVTVLDGLVLVSEFERLKKEKVSIMERILEGTALRLRPVLMTALVAALGFLPMALSTSAGGEVQRPLASVVIGGLITSTVLTLLLLPVLYRWIEERRISFRGQSAINVFILVTFTVAVGAQNTYSLKDARTALEERHPRFQMESRAVEALELGEGAAVDIPKTFLSGQYGQFNTENQDNSFAIEQSFSLPGRYKRRRAWLEQQTEVGREERALSMIDLKRELYLTYYEMNALQRRASLLRQRDSIWKAHVEQMQRRSASGATEELEVLFAENTRAQVELDLMDMDVRREVLRSHLRYLVQDPSADFPSSMNQSSPLQQSSLAEMSWEQHPKIRRAEEMLALKSAEKGKVAADLWPDFSIQYQNMTLIGDQNVNNPMEEYGSGERFHAGQLGLRVPIFYGSRRAEVKKIEQQILQQQEELRQVRAEHQMKWQQAYDLCLQYQRKVQRYEDRMIERAHRIEELASSKLKQGQISLMEWTTSVQKSYEVLLQYEWERWNLHRHEIEFLYLTQEL